MGAIFNIGEKKVRPGLYNRYESNDGVATAGASDGTVAAVFQGDMGELSKVYILTGIDDVGALFGDTGGANGTVQILKDIFNAGASIVKAVRLGAGGTKATHTLMDTTGVAKQAITVTAKSAGAKAYTFSNTAVLGDATSKVFTLYDGTVIKETFVYTAGTLEVDKLVAAGASSKYLTFTKVVGYAGGTDILAVVGVATAFTTAGTNPVIANADYSAAFTLLEAHRFNSITVDSVSTSVHALLSAYSDRIFKTGKMVFAVVSEPTSVALATRNTNAKAFNSYKCIYVGGGFKDSTGTTIEGYRAAAMVAAIVAKVPSNQAVTHYVIPGATNVVEMLTNTQYEDCINSGMLTFSLSPKGSVWIDSGITTLVTLTGEDDEGWKKIKRTKIRFEMMMRVSDTIDPLVGQISNGPDGQTNVIEQAELVLDAMVGENKLFKGAKVIIDPVLLPQGDSAWYQIIADDIDSLEKIYLAYKFRFSNVS